MLAMYVIFVRNACNICSTIIIFKGDMCGSVDHILGLRSIGRPFVTLLSLLSKLKFSLLSKLKMFYLFLIVQTKNVLSFPCCPN